MKKMKKAFKITALLMALTLIIAVFAACGDSESSSEAGGSAADVQSGAAGGSAADVQSGAAGDAKGETQTWGNITVLVPEGMNLKGGNILDENNPDIVNVKKDDNELNYFLITIVDSEDDAKSSLELTRSANEGAKDVTIDAGAAWKGVTYQSLNMDVFQVYGTVDGKVVTVQAFGFAADDSTTKDVLSSIKVK